MSPEQITPEEIDKMRKNAIDITPPWQKTKEARWTKQTRLAVLNLIRRARHGR